MDKHSRQKLLVAIEVTFLCLLLSLVPVDKSWAEECTEATIIQILEDRQSSPDTLGWGIADSFTLIIRFFKKCGQSALIKVLEDKNQDISIRRNAIYILGEIALEAKEVKAAVPPLIKLLEDKSQDSRLRQAAANVLGSIGSEAKDAIPVLTNTLEDLLALKNKQTWSEFLFFQNESLKEKFFSFAYPLRQIAESLQDNADTLSYQDLNQAIGDLEKALKTLKQIEISRVERIFYGGRLVEENRADVNRALEALKLKRQVRIFDRAFAWMLKHPWVAGTAIYVVLLPSLWFAMLQLRPLWLLRLNNALKPYTDFALPASLGGIKVPVRFVLFVGFFHYHPKVLDAWVSSHIDSARKGFQKKTTVSDRAIYIPIPVILDGKNVANLTGKELQPTFADKRCCLLIWGEGGAGKTSLACQLANWAMSDDAVERLCKHPMLPVLIEQELNFEVASGKKAFTEMIRGQFQALIGEADAIPDELLDRLLRQRRILVIVDHLSEMSAATRKEVQPGYPDFPANALIVTSRLEEKLDDVPKTTIKPLRIEGNRLSSFMEAYLTQRDKRDLFTDPEFFNACSRLSLMVGQRNITVLLAKLYAEQMISAKEGARETDLPDNIPDLMLSYLNELNRGAADNEPNNRTVQRDAKAIAWECLKQTYRPSAAKRDDVITVLAALNGNDNAEARLQYLEKRLRLIQTIGSAQDKIRFALDPLAEYLAGLHIVEHYNENEDKWREFLVQADSKPNLEAIKGFLLAVRDCCLAKGTEAKVPDFVAEELGKHAGLVTKVEPAQLAQSLVNDKTILLTRKE